MSIVEAIAKLMGSDKAMSVLAITSGGLALKGDSASCSGFRFLGVTLIIIGVVLLIIECASCIAVYDKSESLMRKMEYWSWFWTVVIAALAIFALAVSSSEAGKSIPGRSYKEYRLEWYSKWMQHKVDDARNWDTHYKKAIFEADVCNKFSKEYEFDTLDVIHTQKLTPFESNCCMPPEDCSFDFAGPTVWVKPENDNYTNVDCNRWDNDPYRLCYDCQTCKAAFLQDVTSHYFSSGVILLIPVVSRVLLIPIVKALF